MTEKYKPEDSEILNLYYAGATSGMVVKALMRQVGEADEESNGNNLVDDRGPVAAQSNIIPLRLCERQASVEGNLHLSA